VIEADGGVRPARAARRLSYDDGLTRMDEGNRGVQWPAARATRQHAANIGLKKKGCHCRSASVGNLIGWLTARASGFSNGEANLCQDTKCDGKEDYVLAPVDNSTRCCEFA
jgi:hypothetical protein